MQSIIDEIAAAEAQADEIRQTALSAAREASAQSKVSAEKELEDLERCERENTRVATFEAEQRGEMLAGKALAEMANAADLECAKAEERIPAAQDYLMKKVFDFA